jgi:hypothetical protein
MIFNNLLQRIYYHIISIVLCHEKDEFQVIEIDD